MCTNISAIHIIFHNPYTIIPVLYMILQIQNFKTQQLPYVAIDYVTITNTFAIYIIIDFKA